MPDVGPKTGIAYDERAFKQNMPQEAHMHSMRTSAHSTLAAPSSQNRGIDHLIEAQQVLDDELTLLMQALSSLHARHADNPPHHEIEKARPAPDNLGSGPVCQLYFRLQGHIDLVRKAQEMLHDIQRIV